MALKLNTQRIYRHPVPVSYYDESGKIVTGSFTGTFKVMTKGDMDDKDARLIDKILIGVDDIELTDEHGNELQGEELLDAVKNDSDLAAACMEAYNGSIEKKRIKKKTSAT